LHGEKIYHAILHLGVCTDTQDSTGAIITAVENINISEETIRSVIKRFEGVSLQQPPVISALKHKGTPLYALARSGNPVQKSAREIFISAIQIRDIDLPYIRLEICCSAGTYIRTLCADIGKALGCGGHLKALRRIKSSGFDIKEAIPLPGVEEYVRSGKIRDFIIGMADALRGMPVYMANSALVEKIRYGKTLLKKDFHPSGVMDADGYVKIIDEKNHLCAVLDVNLELDRYTYCCVFH
jgi:tRNA pseudouridine55 synthase